MVENSGAYPFFSIVIPFHNRIELAINTLHSVLRQSFTGFEIIIVDDGSTDGSGENLKKLFHQEVKVRVIHQPNLERGAARNRGFNESNGTYVVFLDSDDLLLEDHLETLYSKIQQLNSPDFIATKFQFLRNNRRYNSSNTKLKEGYYDYRLFLNGNPLACNVCVRRVNPGLHLFEEDRSYAMKEDWMFFLQNLRSNQLFLVDKVTLLLVDHPERSVQQNNQQVIDKTFLSRAWILKNVELGRAERMKMSSQINYFCAIHCYLDGRRMPALKLLINAFRDGGIKWKFIVLLIKVLIGRKILLMIKH